MESVGIMSSEDPAASSGVESEHRFAAADRAVRFWWLTVFGSLILAAWLVRMMAA